MLRQPVSCTGGGCLCNRLFFIMHQAAPSPDGGYAAFGRLLSGIGIVDAICKDTPVVDRNGSVDVENQPVITAIRLIEKP